MQIISQFAPLPLAQPEKGTAVAMGYFDGIHIGGLLPVRQLPGAHPYRPPGGDRRGCAVGKDP